MGGDVGSGDVMGGDLGSDDVETPRLGGFTAIGGRTFGESVRKVRGLDDADACLGRLDTVGSSRGGALVEESECRCLTPYAGSGGVNS